MAVVGLGTMGAGIAEVFARAGIGVVAIEADPAALSRGVGILDARLSRAVSRGKLTAASEQAEIRGRVRPAAAFSDAAAVDLAIEVVPERMEIKRQIFAELDRVCRPGCHPRDQHLLAVGDRHRGRDHASRPGRRHALLQPGAGDAAGRGRLHGAHRRRAAPTAVADLARRLGKTPVQVGDRAGFVANALLLPYLNHAVGLLETGYASREDIDLAATAGIGLPMGPLALLDLIGLDTSLSIMEVLHGEFGGCPVRARRRCCAAWSTPAGLGRKAGRGIYDYADAWSGQDEIQSGNGAVSAAPDTVTLIGSGDDARPSLPAALARCGHQRDQERGAPERPRPDRRGTGPAGAARGARGRPARAGGRPAPAGGAQAPRRGGQTSLSRTRPLAAGPALAARLGLHAVQRPGPAGFLVGALLYPHLADAVADGAGRLRQRRPTWTRR